MKICKILQKLINKKNSDDNTYVVSMKQKIIYVFNNIGGKQLHNIYLQIPYKKFCIMD